MSEHSPHSRFAFMRRSPSAGSEDPRLRRRRVIAGVCYGLLIGSLFPLSAGFVNVLTFPDLPMRTDWALILSIWVWSGPGLALAGGVAGWPEETPPALGLGAVITAAVMLAAAASQSAAGLNLSALVFVFILLPVAALSLPVAILLRWLAQRSAHALGQPLARRAWLLAGLAAAALLAGILPGSLMRMSGRAEQAVRLVDSLLDEQTLLRERFAQQDGFMSHLGSAYTLQSARSPFSTEGFDISIEFADGYRVTCLVIVYPQREPVFRSCQQQD